MSSLHVASAAGQTAVVTLLLDHGADIHVKNEVGCVEYCTYIGASCNTQSN